MTLILDGTNNTYLDATTRGQLMTLSTAQATTSGTSIDFTGIPTWAKKITVMFNNISTNVTSPIQVQIGSGSVETTGYAVTATTLTNAGATQSSTGSAGFLIESAVSAAAVNRSGIMVITLIGSNLWCYSFSGGTTHPAGILGGGTKTTSGTLDRIRVTTVSGTDTFDNGSVNILIEGSL